MKDTLPTRSKLNKRAASVSQVVKTNFKTIPFGGEWYDLIGNPELKGSWIIWGNSSNGKTRFALQLCKYLAQFAKVAYNSLEEGLSYSMKNAFIQVGMESVKRRVILLDQEPIPQLVARLEKPRSPQIVIIDSWQYTGASYKDYQRLINRFRNKLFIIISHADGKHPAGSVAKSIRYDAFVKIWIEGYVAQAETRYESPRKPFTIWAKGAYEYWGENTKQEE